MMTTPARRRRPGPRRGAAAAELALLLPLLTFLLVATVDFARIFHAYNVVTNCARNGALHASDATTAQNSPYGDYKAAALADAAGLSPAIPSANVTLANGTDADGNGTVAVTVSYDFPLITGYLGLGSTQTITRTVQMRVAPAIPG